MMDSAITASTGACGRPNRPQAEQAQRGAGQRDRMGEREGGGGGHHRPAALQQQHQRHHEQQMIETADDMFNANAEIGARHLPGSGHGGDDGRGFAGHQPRRLHRAAQRCDAQQRIGAAGFQARQANRHAIEAAAAIGPAGGDQRAARQNGPVHRHPAEGWQQWRRAGRQPAQHRRLPHDRPAALIALRQFQIARAQFIGTGRQRRHQQHKAQPQADHAAGSDGRLITTS
jgi:hypothetical protein